MRLSGFTFFLFCNASLLAQDVREDLGQLNSVYDEQSPVLSPDGTTLFFTVGNHPSNVGGKKDPGDIWFSRREGDGWSAPVHAGTQLNNRAYNAVAGFSADGKELFLHGHYAGGATPARTQGIAVSHFNGTGWSRPDNINIPYFMDKSGMPSGSLSSDNSVFVFSADSYGTYGVEDIYVSQRQNGQWTAPRNLGSSINTGFQELSPSISEDGRTLYFSSNGRKGSGSFDVFAARRLDDTWTSWSEPENLGAQINTDGRELYYRFYAGRGLAFFTSTRSSDGYGDLKLHIVKERLPLHDTVVYASISREDKQEAVTPAEEVMSDNTAVAGPPMQAPEAAVTVHGRIANAKTGEPIPAKISFAGPDEAAESVIATASGYSATLPAASYSVRIESTGYISTIEKLDVNAAGMRELEMNFKLQPVEVGTTVNLRNVLFAQAKTDILPESYPELDLVVAFLKENPRVKIELRGHTDGRGVHADNVRLSQERVDKVKEYLVSRGIEAKRISGKGFGGTKPIASNDTEESRRMNRRVEFVIRKF